MPSHASLFTGRDVQHHGVVKNGIVLGDDVPTLAESFRDAGYATAAFVSSFALDPRFGLGRGFDHLDAEFSRKRESISHRTGFAAQHEFEGYDRPAGETRERAAAWLAEVEEPFFLFVHFFDPHAPYQGGAGILPYVPRGFAREVAAARMDRARAAQPDLDHASLAKILRHYQAEVLYADLQLGALLQALDAKGVRDNTLVVVTADHGEGLGQHGTLDHAPQVYDEQLRVPLLFRWPGRIAAGRRIAIPVGLVDLAPTLAQLAGVPALSDADGRSFARSLTGARDPEPRPILGRRRHYDKMVDGHRGTLFFVRDGRWKYIHSSVESDELYDLESDPGETTNLADRERERLKALARMLAAHLALHPQPNEALAIPEEVRKGLGALGYTE
jgi:arylsulfatase A-like enzyme